MDLAVDRVVHRHARWMLFAIGWAVVLNAPPVLTWAGLFVFAVRIVAQRHAWMPRGFGWANWVTLLRLVLAASLGLLPTSAGRWVGALTIFIFCLDGLDGWLAKRFNLASEFGAAFDTETDAYFIAMLSVWLWRQDVVTPWILIPGLLRYAYVLTVAWKGFDVESPRSRWTRWAFSILVVSMAISTMAISYLSTFAAVLGIVVTSMSFGTSFMALFRAPNPNR